MDSNQHISQYLESYLQTIEKPDFAVLITGGWGSGKTFFIKNFLGGEKKKIYEMLTDCERYTVLYISLFGVKNRYDIDEKIFNTLHPALDSAKLDQKLTTASSITSMVGGALGALAGIHFGLPVEGAIAGQKAAKKIEKGARKIKQVANDIENANLISTEFISSLKKSDGVFKKLVIVLDDVERADISLPELLGHINNYVEYLNIPCILLADKDNWSKATDVQQDTTTLHRLSSTQEKIIGKQFQIQTSFDEVWTYWINNDFPGGTDVKTFVADYQSLIKNIVMINGTPNFRALKHVLGDFQLLLNKIEKKHRNNQLFNERLVGDFFSYQYSYHIGSLKLDDIVDRDSQVVSSILGQTNVNKRNGQNQNIEILKNAQTNVLTIKEIPPQGTNASTSNTYEKFVKQYEDIPTLSNFHDAIYAQKWQDLWKCWLQTNFVDEKQLNDLIEKSVWYEYSLYTDLMKICDWPVLDDDSALKAYEAFNTAISEKKLTKASTLMTLYYKIMWFVKRDVFPETDVEFTKKMTTYVKELKNFDRESLDYWRQSILDNDVYLENKQKNDVFLGLLQSKIKKSAQEIEKEMIDDFWRLFNSHDDTSFKRACSRISINISAQEKFPFTQLDPKVFCSNFAKLTRDEAYKCRMALRDRYLNSSKLDEELSFIKKLIKEAKNAMKNSVKPIPPGCFRLYYIIQILEEMVKPKKTTESRRDSSPRKKQKLD